MALVSLLLVLGFINIINGTNDYHVFIIWFDDLSQADVAYNGGDYPTPILDDLANKDAIKINFHYSEQVCSASRSALLTGKYSWRSGMNSVVPEYTTRSFDNTNTLFPQILKDEGWDTYIAGKWHIGMHNEAYLPYNNGFMNGIYSHGNLNYYQRASSTRVSKLDEMFGPPSQEVIDERTSIGITSSTRISSHDTWKIKETSTSGVYTEEPVLENDVSYNEDIYTGDIVNWINSTDGSKPLFLYYSQWTPHSNIADPPVNRRDGSTVDYSACDNITPNKLGEDCTANSDPRCTFCKQVHYASLNIQEIIDTIKDNDNIDWDKTIILITSDNGGDPGNNKYGSTMPLRGTKGGTHEGGVRTPAILKGGFIENILDSYNGIDNMCAYNDLIHISDWYHLFMNILDINSINYNPDDDHNDLEIWDNIKCKCGSSRRDGVCDNNNKKRTELIQMKLCGDKDGNYPADKSFYSSYYRDGDYKLVVQGSSGARSTCDSLSPVLPGTPGGSSLFYYREADGTAHEIPDQSYYSNFYLARKTRMNQNGVFNNLYRSTCLEGMTELERNDNTAQEFGYQDLLIYNIENDKIEACALNDSSKQTEILNKLITRSTEYNAADQSEVIGAFRKQMDSYDCTYDTTYSYSWNDINGGNYNQIWTNYINARKLCPIGTLGYVPVSAKIDKSNLLDDIINNNHDKNNNSLDITNYAIILLFGFLLILCIANICSWTTIFKRNKIQRKEYEMVNINKSEGEENENML